MAHFVSKSGKSISWNIPFVCANEATIHGDIGDVALQGICNLFGSLTVATITQSKSRHPGVYVMKLVFAAEKATQAPDRLAEAIVDKLNNPSTSSDFDFHEGVNQVLADVGMSAADSDGQLSFIFLWPGSHYSQPDPVCNDGRHRPRCQSHRGRCGVERPDWTGSGYSC
jgi:hypothetical protein